MNYWNVRTYLLLPDSNDKVNICPIISWKFQFDMLNSLQVIITSVMNSNCLGCPRPVGILQCSNVSTPEFIEPPGFSRQQNAISPSSFLSCGQWTGRYLAELPRKLCPFRCTQWIIKQIFWVGKYALIRDICGMRRSSLEAAQWPVSRVSVCCKTHCDKVLGKLWISTLNFLNQLSKVLTL